MNKLLISSLFSLITLQLAAQKFNIFSDFPSGNATIDNIRNDTIWVRPDLRDTKGDWFYWCFAVKNAKSKTLNFVITRPNCLTSKGPAISLDGGNHWSWVNPENSWDSQFSYTFKTNSEVRFSMGMPYTQKQFQQFIQPFLKSEFVTIDTLSKTKAGRSVERLTLKPKSSAVKFKVLIATRHHACEMMGNYEMEGIINEILKDEWLKKSVEFCLIPFMDKDGVENGDQGKNRIPHDHNRDYVGTSIYNSVAALRNWVPLWSEKKMAIALDLHCPWIKAENNENIYVVGSPVEKIAAQQRLFCSILKSTNKGELKISEKSFFPYGKDWNSAEKTTPGLSFSKWSAQLEGVKLPISIEFPYANNEGQTITQENARAFGTDLARAIKKYLMQL
ncbi:MAG: hypothetical protein WCI31_05060 [Prolixibacteraceae bacterium]